MAKVKTARDLFYHVDDVMRAAGLLPQQELQDHRPAQPGAGGCGFCTCDGRVSRRYIDKRYGLEAMA